MKKQIIIIVCMVLMTSLLIWVVTPKKKSEEMSQCAKDWDELHKSEIVLAVVPNSCLEEERATQKSIQKDKN